MKLPKFTAVLAILHIASTTPLLASWYALDEWADQINEASQFSIFDDQVFIDFGGQIDLTGYHTDPQGFYGFFFPEPGKSTDFSQRLTLTADIFIGDHWLAHAKLRWDDGIHPGVAFYYKDYIEARWDEFYLRWSTLDKKISIQAGQFTPLYGTFLRRQNTWDAGLISYPYLYEGVTSVSDALFPADTADFASRSQNINNPLGWLPVAWAPLYPRGVSVFGNNGTLEYAIGAFNNAPSSRGITWNNNDYSDETWMMRLAWISNPALQIGLNLTHGAYIQKSAESLLPAGTDRGDYIQRNFSFDITYKARKLQLWLEAFLTEFEVPNVPDTVRIYSYYLEGRYDLSATWWLSARWNHELYNSISDNLGQSLDWDNEVKRIDLGLGFRPARHFQIKAQFSHKSEAGPFQNGENLYLLETTFQF